MAYRISHIFTFSVFAIFTFFSNIDLKAGHNKKIDSLNAIIKSSGSDTVKVNACLKIANLLLKEDSNSGLQQLKKALFILNSVKDKNFIFRSIEKCGRICYSNKLDNKAQRYWHEGLSKAKRENNREWQSKFYFRIASYLQGNEFSKQSISWFDSSLSTAQGGDEKFIATLLMYTGRSHYDIGDYKRATDLYFESQKLFEKNKWLDKDYGHLLHFLGSVYKRQKLYDKALVYYEKELELARQIKNKHLEAEALYLCVQVNDPKMTPEKEMQYLQKALDLYKEEKNTRMEALMYENIADKYSQNGDTKKAIEMLEQALEIYLGLNEMAGIPGTYNSLGDMYSKIGQHSKAQEYLKKAMEAALKIETKQLMHRSNITESMAYNYAAMGDYHSAFDKLLLYQQLNDSLNNQSNAEYLNNLSKKYETEKKEQEIALLNADKKIQSEEILRKNNQSRTLIIISVLGLLITIISVLAFINKRKTSKLLVKQVEEINYQNSVILEKNKDITDSIQYAKRLQEAVLPEIDTLNNFFKEAFVLFRPKDIVSGDFYWFEQKENKTIIIVGDCTGHGVPGAFMSILGHNLLNQIILEDGVTDPALILQHLDKNVSNALNKKGSKKEYNDGMDIAVCVIDKASNHLSFSGANRPLIIKRNSELVELKPNKFAIGGTDDDRCKLFIKQDYSLKDDDVLYLFSDGYNDQFGGPNGKKFKYKQLIGYLNQISSMPLDEQLSFLDATLQTWRGNLEQVDDICIIGVKI